MHFFPKNLEKEELKKKQQELTRRIIHLDRFQGSLSEYCNFKGQEYVIIDTRRPDKFVYENEHNLLEKLVNEGCVALIHYETHQGYYGEYHYGTPVKLK